MKTTQTFVTLEVTARTYEEIAAKMRAADYGHVIDGAIDMHGIALVSKTPQCPTVHGAHNLQCSLSKGHDGDHIFSRRTAIRAIRRSTARWC